MVPPEIDDGQPETDEARRTTGDDQSGPGPDGDGESPVEGRNSPSGGNGRKVLRVAVPVVLILAIGGLLWWLHARHYVSTNDAFVDAQVVRIAPQVAGVVSELRVQPNEHVEPGSLLVAIAPDTVLPVIARQKADISEARAQASATRASVQSAQAARQKASAAVSQAEAQYRKAKSDLARLMKARKMSPDSVAASDVDAVRTALDSAKARLISARGDADAATAELASARLKVQSANAVIRSAQAQAEGGKVSLDQTRIVAPMSGSIANIAINRGSYVAPGLQMMALVPDNLWVTANFKETQLSKIHVGDPVDIKIDAYPGRTFAGKVDSIQRASGQEFQLLPAQNATGNFVKVVQRVPVRIVFTEKLPGDLAIGPGMSVVPTVKVR